MTLKKKSRFYIWLIRDLTVRYTRNLIFGFFLGFISAVIFWKFYPFLIKTVFFRTERIGIIGDFTLNSLPNAIQKEISIGLTTLSYNGAAAPGVAEEWEASPSGTFYKFYLKNNLYWHDGTRLTAADINYNFRNVIFKVADELTVEASLTEPYGAFPVFVSKPLFKSGLIGLGEFSLANISLKGDSIRSFKLIPAKGNGQTVKNYQVYKNEPQAILAYKLGEIDVLEDLTNPRDLVSWKNTVIEEKTKYDRLVAVYFNMNDPELSDKSFRLGLGYATPVIGNYEKAYQPIPKTSWAYTDDVRHFKLDFDQAKKYLQTDKLASSSSKLVISTFAQYLDVAQEIANSWSQAGIKTIVKVENSVPHDFRVLLTAVDLPPDPDQYPLWHSTQQNTNISNYSNAKVDKLLEDARKEVDQEKRKQMYIDFAKRLVDDAPALFLYYPKVYTVIRK